MLTQLMDQLEDYDLLPDSLHGFRRGRGTSSAVSKLMTLLQNEGSAYVAAYDFSAAFDTISSAALSQ